MTEFENYINKEIDIATWEDKDGALKMRPLETKKNNSLIIVLGLVVALSLIYSLVKKN